MSRRNKIFRWVLLTGLGLVFAALFLPFYAEILLAVFFAFALDPLTRRLSEHRLFHRRGWVAVTLTGLFLLVATPIGIATYNVYEAVEETAAGGVAKSKTFQDFTNLRDALTRQANRVIRTFRLEGEISSAEIDGKLVAKAGEKLVAFSTLLMASLPAFGLSLFIFCCALYFFLAESRKIKRVAEGARLMPAPELDRLILLLRSVCRSILVASMLVGGLQAGIVAGGALAFGAGDFFVIFVVTFFFSFIPVIGAAPVAFALAIFGLVRQDYGDAIGLAIVGIVAGTVDNVVRPVLVGAEENVHPVIILLAIIGGLAIFGFAGLFLGPLITTITMRVYACYVYKDESALLVETRVRKSAKAS